MGYKWNEVYNEDCMIALRQMPDNFADLCICDPPYGVKYARGKNGWGINDNRPSLEDVKWDSKPPSQEYFNELIRVSKNQIIWGGNYFTDKLPVSKCWIIWDKINNTENKSVFADGELAWTSFNKVVKIFKLRTMGFINDTKDKQRIHPTQKPTELYKWLLTNYAKQGDKILDTHMGSGSSIIACYDMKFDYMAFEIDKDYYDSAMKRITKHMSQMRIDI